MQQLIEEKDTPEVTLSHPKAKEWIVSMAKANYQELAKLASEFPELVKLQVSLRSRENTNNYSIYKSFVSYLRYLNCEISESDL